LVKKKEERARPVPGLKPEVFFVMPVTEISWTLCKWTSPSRIIFILTDILFTIDKWDSDIIIYNWS